MHRIVFAFLTLAAIFALGGCGVGTDFPLVDNPTVTVTAMTDTTITISWQPAANESNLGRGFQYEVYTSAGKMATPDDLIGATLQVSATTSEFGEDPAVAMISSLSLGTWHHINVAAVNTRSGDLELYDDVVGFTSGGEPVADTYTGAIPYFNHRPDITETAAGTVVEYTIDLGATSSDVSLVFSNPAATPLSRPEVALGSLIDIDFSTWPVASGAPAPALLARAVTPTGPVILRDRPEITDWQAPPLSPGSRALAPPPPPPVYDAVDDTANFYDDSTSNLIPATCRAVVDNGDGTKLNVWVEDSEWFPTATPDGKINQTIVDFLAASFLASTADNDIFDWLTNIYGDEWGPHGFGNLITDNDEITILLWNIGNDGAGGVVGYFWSKDNFLATGTGGIDYSNERVMFYLDSESLGTREETTWDATDYWPTEMVATLAHEFQHMVQYYQRDVVLGASTETWLNEMMSMVSEDLVGRKLYAVQGLDIAGPRGVEPSWDSESGGAGDAGNDLGRLPLYNAAPSISLTTWLSNDDVLKSYSISYAFGAFLSRNFGGAELMQAMMDSASSNSEQVISSAIETAAGTPGVTMGDLLWQWGVSVLLSDDETAPAEVQMNTGVWIDSTVGTTYSLGSINHFNYDQEGFTAVGPRIHTESTYGLTEMEGMSTIFYELALNQTGALTAVLLVPDGVDYTVVVK